MTKPTTMPLSDAVFIQEFAAFCRTKGDEEYEACSPSVCALAQFGHPGVIIGGSLKGYFDRAGVAVPSGAYEAAVHYEPHTFSALADRLEALLADAPIVQVHP